jgi:hypothetical protein
MDQATHNKIVSFIWGIADDVLRDLFKRSKYPDVILPMCLLRRQVARALNHGGHMAPKVAVGTAYSTSSRVWYTLDAGCVTEVYYPTIDTPQIRDLQFLLTDGETFFHDERRNFTSEIAVVKTFR